MSILYFTIASILAVSHAAIQPKDLFNVLDLSDADLELAYEGLNANRDKVINLDDLHIHYYNKEVDFAKEKFMDLIDTRRKDGTVDKDELNEFLFKRPVTEAVWECTYVRSKSIKEYCFADQILAYVLLVIDTDASIQLFDSIEKANPDGKICPDDVAKLKEHVTSFDAPQQENFLKEIGGDDKIITKDEFIAYVGQEDLQYNFRTCRKDLQGCKGVYDFSCLTKKLILYTMNELTELDIATLFNDYQRNDDYFIVKADLTNGLVCDDVTAGRFVMLMDSNGDGAVSYGEFRNYLKTHTVKMQLEISCTKVKRTQEEEMVCYKEKVTNLAIENHKPIWLETVKLDTVLLFEELDTTNDGLIQTSEDLVKGRAWDEKVASKMVAEMDGWDDDKDVSLKELMVYIAYPNMVYALNDCLINRCEVRTACYEVELKDEITYMLEKSYINAFFRYYANGNNNITYVELVACDITEDEVDNMLVEMGMGDKEITFLEFFWFVRQQRLSHMFYGCNKFPGSLHPILRKYLDEVMTEHDTEELFRFLDKNGNGELEPSDFGATTAPVVKLIERIDSIGQDRDNTANFYEFWVWLNTPKDALRKSHLEEECTKKYKKQADELSCYNVEIFNVK